MFRYDLSRCSLGIKKANPLETFFRHLIRAPPLHAASQINSNALCWLRNRVIILTASTMAKRKGLSTAASGSAVTRKPILPPPLDDDPAPPPKRRASQRKVSHLKQDTGSTNPNKNANVLDGPEALRASPDAHEVDERIHLARAGMLVEKQVKEGENDSPLSEISYIESPIKKPKNKGKGKASTAPKKEPAKAETTKKPAASGKDKKGTTSAPQFLDPEAEGDEEADEEEIQAALSRPPPVNSDYLPLPWKGRLGYVRQIVEFTLAIC